mgnify:CR=1 FL=1
MSTTRDIMSDAWYKDAVIYELHVRAFHDSNDDGIGAKGLALLEKIVRAMCGHGRVNTRNPPPGIPTELPSSSTMSAAMPGIGSVADPGFVGATRATATAATPQAGTPTSSSRPPRPGGS